MLRTLLALAGCALLLAACGEREMKYQREMSKEAATDPSVATTAVPTDAGPPRPQDDPTR